MSGKRWISPLLVVLVALSMLAACGDDDDSSETKAGGDASSATTAAADTGKGDDHITVTMHDYAFAVSGPLTAGGTIEIKNEGDELHMMGIGKLKAGATVAQVRDALAKADPKAEGDPTAGLIDQEVGWPGGFVTPGHSVTVSTGGMGAGTYALVCFLPTEGGGGPHFSKGMIGELDVTAGSAEASTKPDATYKVTPGQAIQGPATLKAGKRTIEITGDGDISKQEPQLVKAQSADQTPNEINDLINKYFGEFEGGSGPEKGAGKKVGEFIVFSGFDIGANHQVSFTYDFEPGTYYLAAPDTDTNNEDGPAKVPTELIKITVE